MYGHTETCIWMCIAALFTIAGTWKQLRGSSVGEWINGLVRPEKEYYTALKSNGLPSHEKT